MFHPLGHPLERGWVGRVDGDRVVQLAAQTLQSFFTGGGTAREHAQYPLDETRAPRAGAAPAVDQDLRRARVVRVRESRGRRRARWARLRADSASRSPSESRRGDGPRRRDRRVHGARRLAPRGVAPPKDRDFALGLGPVVVTPDAAGPVDRRLRLGGPRSRWRRRAPRSTRATSSLRPRPSRSPGPGDDGQDRGRRDRSAGAAHRSVTRSCSTGTAPSPRVTPCTPSSRSSGTPMSSRRRRRTSGHASRCRRSSRPSSDGRGAARRGRRVPPREHLAASGVRRPRRAPDPLVVSMGFHELIEPLLARERIEVPVVANRLDVRPDGWRALFREQAVAPSAASRASGGRRRSRRVRLRRRRVLRPLRRAGGVAVSSPATGLPSTWQRRVSLSSASTTSTTSLGRSANNSAACCSDSGAVRLRALDRAVPRLRHGRRDRPARGRPPPGRRRPGGTGDLDRGRRRDRALERGRGARDRRLCSALPFDLAPFRDWAAREPVLGPIVAGAPGLPPDAQPAAVRGARRRHHDAADLASRGRGAIRGNFVAPLRRAARVAWEFPTRERVRELRPRHFPRSASRARRRSTCSSSPTRASTSARSPRSDDDEVIAAAHVRPRARPLDRRLVPRAAPGAARTRGPRATSACARRSPRSTLPDRRSRSRRSDA